MTFAGLEPVDNVSVAGGNNQSAFYSELFSKQLDEVMVEAARSVCRVN